MRLYPGSNVRTVHGSIGYSGVAVRRVENSPRDGGERWLIRWTRNDGQQTETRWDPDLLVPLNQPREQDPVVALCGVSEDGQTKAWLTRKGIMWTPATTSETEMIIADLFVFDIIYAGTQDR